LVYIIRLY